MVINNLWIAEQSAKDIRGFTHGIDREALLYLSQYIVYFFTHVCDPGLWSHQ